MTSLNSVTIGLDGAGAEFSLSSRYTELVPARRDRLGRVDLRTGTAALGTGLAAAGLRLALERKSALLVFAWLERSRAQAFRARPVRPPGDPHAAAVLAELRQLGMLIREAELTGSRIPASSATWPTARSWPTTSSSSRWLPGT